MANWNPKIPLDWYTVLLCFLAGTALSLPVGSALPWIIFQPPEALLVFYGLVVAVSWIAVPVWLVCWIFGYPRVSPYVILLVILVFILIGMLFPAINGSRVY